MNAGKTKFFWGKFFTNCDGRVQSNYYRRISYLEGFTLGMVVRENGRWVGYISNRNKPTAKSGAYNTFAEARKWLRDEAQFYLKFFEFMSKVDALLAESTDYSVWDVEGVTGHERETYAKCQGDAYKGVEYFLGYVPVTKEG